MTSCSTQAANHKQSSQQHPVQQELTDALLAEFIPSYFDIIDESYMHCSGPNAGTHFKVVMVSEAFTELKLLARQKAFNACVKHLWPGKHIHALTYKLYTPEEWAANPVIADSPDCLGVGK